MAWSKYGLHLNLEPGILLFSYFDLSIVSKHIIWSKEKSFGFVLKKPSSRVKMTQRFRFVFNKLSKSKKMPQKAEKNVSNLKIQDKK